MQNDPSTDRTIPHGRGVRWIWEIILDDYEAHLKEIGVLKPEQELPKDLFETRLDKGFITFIKTHLSELSTDPKKEREFRANLAIEQQDELSNLLERQRGKFPERQ